MFQTGMFLAKSDYMWIKVAVHVGGKVRGYVLMDINKEIEKLNVKNVQKSSRDTT